MITLINILNRYMNIEIKYIIIVLFYYIISIPYTYFITNSLINVTLDNNKCPTYLGVFIHTLIFSIILYYLIDNKKEHLTLKQDIPPMCSPGKNNCPSGRSCLPNYDYCGPNLNPALCKDYKYRCFKRCNNDHDCAKADNCWDVPKLRGKFCSYKDYTFNK